MRAGDVHKDMGLANAMPAVCSAIGGYKFETLAIVSLTNREGPPNGANVYFTFSLSDQPRQQMGSQTDEQPIRMSPSPTKTISPLNLATSLVLVSCVKRKLDYPAPARELYTSDWFQKAKTLVESAESHWFILSALYGLIPPNQVIAPYDYTLKKAKIAERRAWAGRVLEELLIEAQNFERVVFFAGQRYREFLQGPLRQSGLEVITPMEHLALGEQLAWLGNQQ